MEKVEGQIERDIRLLQELLRDLLLAAVVLVGVVVRVATGR
jgi:hypothetical protein